jgi:hypothetical protein
MFVSASFGLDEQLLYSRAGNVPGGVSERSFFGAILERLVLYSVHRRMAISSITQEVTGIVAGTASLALLWSGSGMITRI